MYIYIYIYISLSIYEYISPSVLTHPLPPHPPMSRPPASALGHYKVSLTRPGCGLGLCITAFHLQTRRW